MICVSDIKLPVEFFSPDCSTNFAPTMGDLLREHFEVGNLEEFVHTYASAQRERTARSIP